MSVICLFPGQGSQVKGMGGDLFDRYDDWTITADTILDYSIKELCLDDPRSELGRTEFTQPALFVVNAMTYRARLEDGRESATIVAGHSLGEYNALAAAGVFDFETGVKLVRRRGEIMSKVTGGGMAAVIGLNRAAIENVLAQSDAGRRLDVANFNSFDQTVIAGPQADLASVKSDFQNAGVRAYVPLNVSAPFHSRYMKAAQDEFAKELDATRFYPPVISVIANVTGRPHDGDAARVRQTLAQQIGHSVRWLDTMLYLLDQPEPQFEEVGPGNVLTKLLAQIRKMRQ